MLKCYFNKVAKQEKLIRNESKCKWSTISIITQTIEIVNESKPKLNKLWFNQEKKFCNNFMQKWSDNSDILMNLTHKVDKPVVTKRFIRTLKNKIYEKITTFDCKSYLGYLNN